jgi:hypothetical protein
MKRWFESFLSELHAEHLKPLGFRKTGHTISRAMQGYHERFNFQGSSWNSSGVKWRFYLNCGVEFTDLPSERQWSYFPHTHWAGRAEQLVPTAPLEWDYGPATDPMALKAQLHALVLDVSRQFGRRTASLRVSYLEKLERRRQHPVA